MNRFAKRILFLVIVATVFCGTIGCSLKPDPRKGQELLEYNGFSYTRYIKSNNYYLTGDQGKNNPEIMHINPYCDGDEVKYFGETVNSKEAMSTIMFSYAPSLINVETLSIPYCMERYSMLEDYPIKEAPRKIILVRNSNSDEGFISLHDEYYEDENYFREIYCSSISYDGRVSLLTGNGGVNYPNGECSFNSQKGYRFKICKANTAYMFNYENCPNDGYFFINDFDYGTTIECSPYEPLREGYIFSGWYKEPECINIWNFDIDSLPETQYNENGKELYRETKLYAKWIEN